MWPIDSFLDFNFWQVTSILLVPILIDLPRAIGKSILLLGQEVYVHLKKVEVQHESFPFVSVIIPAHNEEEVIGKSIQRLLESDYPRKEVVVVDDGSTDNTYGIAKLFARKGLIKLVRRESASGKKARAVNLGLRLAKGDVILVLDADTWVEAKALSNIAKCFSDPAVGAVAGNVRVGNKTNLLTRLQAYEYMIAMEMGRRYQSMLGLLLIIPGAFGAVRREILWSVGAYDVDTITEDFDLTLKIRKTHKKVAFAPDAITWTIAPETLKALIRQRHRWDRGQMQTLRKHKNIFFKSRFGLTGLLGAPDMVFADMILTFLRIGWMGLMLVANPTWLGKILVLTFTFYLVLELVQGAVAGILSPRKEDLLCMLYAPILVLIYRPLLSFVRLKAYLDGLKGATGKW